MVAQGYLSVLWTLNQRSPPCHHVTQVTVCNMLAILLDSRIPCLTLDPASLAGGRALFFFDGDQCSAGWIISRWFLLFSSNSKMVLLMNKTDLEQPRKTHPMTPSPSSTQWYHQEPNSCQICQWPTLGSDLAFLESHQFPWKLLPWIGIILHCQFEPSKTSQPPPTNSYQPKIGNWLSNIVGHIISNIAKSDAR